MKLNEIMRMAFEADQERLKAEHLAKRSKTRDAMIALGTRIRQHGRIEMSVPKRANARPNELETCTDMGDPANAHYLFPLENEKDEEDAWDMAEINYNVWAESFSDDITEAEAEQVFQQCVVDCRRMMFDREYGRQFGLHQTEEGDHDVKLWLMERRRRTN